MKNFFVSCVGAYNDSGIGTGGFVGICKGRTIIIDSNDCTGLYRSGNRYFRFVRSVKALVEYDNRGIRQILFLPDVQDVHDIYVQNDIIVCVSTGTNEILNFDPKGNLLNRRKFNGTGDAWHLNCTLITGETLYISAFGKFDTHRQWNTEGCQGTGFVMNAETGEMVIQGLSGPHTPRLIDGKWFVCDSHKRTLAIFFNGERTDINLDGFTRGLTYDEDFVYVGVSADRKASTERMISRIKIIDRRQLIVVDEIEIPFPEIYDIVFIEDDIAKNILTDKKPFEFFWAATGQVKHLQNQVRNGEQAVISLQKSIDTMKVDYEQRLWGKKGIMERAGARLDRIFFKRK